MRRIHAFVLIGLCALALSCNREEAAETAGIAGSAATPVPASTPPPAEGKAVDAAVEPVAQEARTGSPTALPDDICALKGSDPVVAVVDDRIPINLSQVLALTADYERRFEQAGGAPENERGAVLQKTRRQGLEQVVDQQRIYLESLSTGLEPTEDEVWAAIDDLTSRQTFPVLKSLNEQLQRGEISEDQYRRLKREATDNAINQMAEAQGWTRADFDDQVQKLARVRKMMTEMVYADIVPTTPEMELHYRQNKETMYKSPARADVFRIEMHANEDRTLAETRQQIEVVHEEVKQGLEGIEDPKEMLDTFVNDYVRKYSDGPNVRGGGYVVIYGTEARGELEQSTINMAYAVEPFEISPIFDIHDGYSFLIVKQVYPRVQRTFEEMKKFIRNQMIKERRESRTLEFYSHLEEKYPVEVCEDNLYAGLLPAGDSSSMSPALGEAGVESGTGALTRSP